jgi:hypothetical protein
VPFLSRPNHAAIAEQNRRVQNHQAWEDDNPRGAIRAKGRHAVDQAIARERGNVRASRRTQRNNRREY